MIYVTNIALMFLCIAILVTFLWCTRRCDDVLWWALRFLLLHGLISVVYMTYGAIHAGFAMSLSLMLIRLGFASLTMALALLWFLLQQQAKEYRRQRFNDRIKAVLKDKD